MPGLKVKAINPQRLAVSFLWFTFTVTRYQLPWYMTGD